MENISPDISIYLPMYSFTQHTFAGLCRPDGETKVEYVPR